MALNAIFSSNLASQERGDFLAGLNDNLTGFRIDQIKDSF